MELAGFIGARLAEAERRAQAALSEWDDEGALQEWNDLPDASFAHARNLDPASALRDAAAKRAIVAWHAKQCTCSWVNDEGDDLPEDVTGYGCPTLVMLASAWSDHPDYDESWAPSTR